MGGYDLDLNYDYTQHWSRRDKEEPRLACADHAASLKEFHHQFAQAFANESHEYFNDEKKCAEIFENIVAREKYHMAMENLYGFGKFILNNQLAPVFNDLYNRMYPEYIEALKDWWSLSIQCATNTYECENETVWREKKAEYIANLEKFGVDVDYETFRQKEIKRVTAYCAYEDACIKAANGWRGD